MGLEGRTDAFTGRVLGRPELQTATWIPAIDGWRALAVSAVVLHHTNGTNEALAGWAIANLGVAVFFCISGFLAYYVLWLTCCGATRSD
jgi:peptidoglycan/LPS O-acetylase OafA/YrhL